MLAAVGLLVGGALDAWAADTGCKAVLKAVGKGVSTTTNDYNRFRATVMHITTSTGIHATTGYTQTADNSKIWVTLMANDGTVCAVTTDGNVGTARDDGKGIGSNAWLLSRVISAQKANTANGLGMPSAKLYSLAQSGTGYLYGLPFGNPVDTATAYNGSDSSFGGPKDPLAGKRVGGVSVVGGGLPVYKDGTIKIGGIGVSGDTSCEDQSVAYQIRAALSMAPTSNLDDSVSVAGSGHPNCGDTGLANGDRPGWK